MSSQERFPGIKILQEIEERAQNLDEGVSLSELPTILDRLHLAAEKGLPLDGWVDATRLAFLTILDALDKAEDSLDLPESVVTAVLNSVHSDWYHLIPMLPLDSQVNAWNLLDLLCQQGQAPLRGIFMREAKPSWSAVQFPQFRRLSNYFCVWLPLILKMPEFLGYWHFGKKLR